MKKRIFSAIVTCFLIIAVLMLPCQAADEETKKETNKGPEIESEAAILVHYDSGITLFEKNADKKCYPASTTKIMTAVLALDKLDTETVLTASETAVDIDRDGSNIGIIAGESFKVIDLLRALLIHSANDAANVLAEGVSGNISDFVALMNEKAAELGMENTHFANAHGYHDENHYTTARDILKLSVYAMKKDVLREIVAIPNMDLSPTDKYAEARHLSSNNMLINPEKGTKYLYDGAIGIKTGHTEAAGYCLSSMVERNGVRYVCVVMGAPVTEEENYSFKDTISLYDYGFENFKMKTISSENEIVATAKVRWAKDGKNALLTVREPLRLLLPADFDTNKLETNMTLPDRVNSPVKKGENLGTIDYIYDGSVIGTVELVANEDINRSIMRMIFGTVFDIIFSKWVIGTVVVLFVLLLIVRNYNLRKRRRKRALKRRQQRRNF